MAVVEVAVFTGLRSRSLSATRLPGQEPMAVATAAVKPMAEMERTVAVVVEAVVAPQILRKTGEATVARESSWCATALAQKPQPSPR